MNVELVRGTQSVDNGPEFGLSGKAGYVDPGILWKFFNVDRLSNSELGFII